jgi:methanogenic corrinoid protein MtbC1
MNLHASLIEKIRNADRVGANEMLDAWAADHGYDRLLEEILEPALLQIGDEWKSAEKFTLAQAYVAAKVAEDMLTKIASRSSQPQGAPTKGPVILGNVEEDFHALGRRMVGIFLRADGWEVHDLGNDVMPDAFVDKAVEMGARVIGVSAMMYTNARNIRRVREEIDRRGLTGKIQLAVGGAVFLVCPGLVEEIGGDGTAPSAIKTPQLFDQLWAQSLRLEARK